MNNINCLIVEGNITREPEFKTTAHGHSLCKIPIAVNHYYKKTGTDEYENEVSYFDVETYGKLAEICSKFSQKGRGVSVVGRIKQNRWKSDDGKNQSRVTIIAEKVEFKTKFSTDTKEEKKEAITPVSELAEKALKECAMAAMNEDKTVPAF